MEARKKEDFICPLHYFDGEHFIAEDCDLDESGNCAICGQKFDYNGDPIKFLDLEQSNGYLYKKIFFRPRDMV